MKTYKICAKIALENFTMEEYNMLNISLFDILDYLPRTDCGSCISGSCTEFAKRLQNEEAELEECRRLFAGGYTEEIEELRDLLKTAKRI